jgi:hypothetical protein
MYLPSDLEKAQLFSPQIESTSTAHFVLLLKRNFLLKRNLFACASIIIGEVRLPRTRLAFTRNFTSLYGNIIMEALRIVY